MGPSGTVTARFIAKRLMGLRSDDEWPWARQLPRGSSGFHGVDFLFCGDSEDYDVAVVFGGLPESEVAVRSTAMRVFVASEPATYERYHPRFLDQFDLVLTTDPRTRHRNRVITHCGNPWHVGMWREDGALSPTPLTFDDLAAFEPPKERLLSVVTSAKSILPGHRERIAFVLAMKRYFGDDLDVYGRGIRDVPDKLAALAPYRFHLAIENSVVEHYWTEKLADPILMLSFPIYYGAPNVVDYLPRESFAPIDIRDPRAAAEAIVRVIDRGEDDNRWSALREARRRVLEEHNLFSLIARAIRTRLPSEPENSRSGAPTHLRSNASFRRSPERFLMRVGHLITRKLAPGFVGQRSAVAALRREIEDRGGPE